MSYLLVLVLHDPDLTQEVITAWEEAGVGGVTILPSTGPGRLWANGGPREDLPLIPALSDLLEQKDVRNETLFSVVPDDLVKDQVIAATERVVGDLSQPNTGILAVLPVAEVYGMKRK